MKFKTVECPKCKYQISSVAITRHDKICDGNWTPKELRPKKIRGIDFDPNEGYKFGRICWNKGQTKLTNSTLLQASKLLSSKYASGELKSTFVKHSAETKAKISKIMIGNNRGGRCKWFEVNGVKVQGTWERDIAIKLTSLNIAWIKVKKGWPYKMHEKNRHYTPDFFLPEYNLYLEVKGYWWGDDKEKMKCVAEQHNDKRIIIIEKQEFEQILRGELVW